MQNLKVESPKPPKRMDSQSFTSPMPTKYSASTRIEYLSASANRREAVNSMSAQNLV